MCIVCILNSMKDIAGYEGRYAITKGGKVYSYSRDNFMKPYKTNLGYLKVALDKKKYRVHRLVAITYLDNNLNLPEVNHKNGIRDDNRLDNLEWCTRLQNMQDAYKRGTHACFKTRTYDEETKQIIVDMFVSGKRLIDISKELNLNYNVIRDRIGRYKNGTS